MWRNLTYVFWNLEIYFGTSSNINYSKIITQEIITLKWKFMKNALQWQLFAVGAFLLLFSFLIFFFFFCFLFSEGLHLQSDNLWSFLTWKVLLSFSLCHGPQQCFFDKNE